MGRAGGVRAPLAGEPGGRLLLEAEAAAALTRDGTSGGEELYEIWRSWIEQEERRATQGELAGALVERWRGASRRSAEMLGPGYFVTTPSNVTDRGTMSPSVSPVISTSLHRLRTLIRKSATPLPPAS